MTASDEIDPAGLITLRQAVDAGLLTSIAAARRASTRPGFPEPVMSAGVTFYYRADELRAWRFKRFRGTPVPLVMVGDVLIAGDVTPDIWKPAGPLYPGYEAWSRGAIRSVDRVLANGRRQPGRLLTIRLSTRGYPQVDLRDASDRKVTIEVHTLMMLAFEGPCPPGKQVRHWNDISDDNRWAPGGESGCRAGLGNLIYGTPKQNARDKLRNLPDPLVTHRSWPRRVADYGRSLTRRGSR